MTVDELAVGVRIRLTKSFGGGSYPGATIAEIPAGETAVIIEVDPTGEPWSNDQGFINVHFDNHLATLDEWNNTFFIGFDDTGLGWDSTIADWEVVRGFY